MVAAPALAVTPTSAPPSTVSPCTPQQLGASYTLMPFSQGAGHVAYLLTVTNRSTAASCSLTGPLPARLLDRFGHGLPTGASTSPKESYTVVLAPGQWAQAQSRFSPDIAGAGENGRHCEPVAHSLRLALGGGTVLASMDPTPVCQFGRIGFGRLRAVVPTAACTASSLTATLARISPPFGGFVSYRLGLTNGAGYACHLNSYLGLRLLAGMGGNPPTQVVSGVQSPYVIPAHTKALAVAMLRTRAGPGEPRGGACEPIASRIKITPLPGAVALFELIQPALHACHKGLIMLSGLYPAA